MISPLSALGAKPHPRIAYRVLVDGKDISPALAKRLMSLTHTDNRGFEADTVDLDLDDSDGALDLPARGAVLELEFGWEADGLVKKGSYTVTEIAHAGAPDVLSIRAASMDLSAGLTTQRDRSWHMTTVGAIVETIAEENGLTPLVNRNLAAEGIVHQDQTNESNANFLTRLGQMFDAIATVKDGRLMFIPAGGGITASGKPIPPIKIARQDGDRHQFLITDRQTYKAVRALYHDTDQAVKGEVTWGDEENAAETGKRPKPASAPTVGQYKPLASTYPTRAKALRAARIEWQRMQANRTLRAAYVGVRAKYNDRNLSVSGEVTYGEADEQAKKNAAQKRAEKDADKFAAPPTAFDRTGDNIKTLRHVYSSRANALRAARAEWRRLQRGVASFIIQKAIGLPDLFPETPCTVSGFKPQIDSTDWIVTRVINTIAGDGGYSQRIELEIKATEVRD